MCRKTLTCWIVRSRPVLLTGLLLTFGSPAGADELQSSGIPRPLSIDIDSRAPNRVTRAEEAGQVRVGYTEASVSQVFNDCNQCESGCESDGSCPWPTINSLLGDDSPVKIGGWTQWGYHSENNGLFNNHKHNINLHQQWFYVEKAADGGKGFDWGFRFDAIYGVDAQDTQAFGNLPRRFDFMNNFDHGIYGWALPQVYGEVAMGDLSVKMGHFFTIVGYEVVTAPGNFFYSHAYTMNNSEPFTHTGVLATYQASEDVTVYAGWTLGWDTGFDRNDDGSNFLGGFSVPLGENVTFTYITTVGDLGARGEGYSHSTVTDVKLNDCMNYVLQSDLVNTNAGADHQYGVNQYLFYKVNDMIKLGSRVEWWKNAGNSQYAWTSGVNIKPCDNFILRPEVRQDWNPGNGTDVTTFGIDVILSY